MSRDDFSASVKSTVAERAGGLCSIPGCNRLTIGPHTDPSKSKRLGVAAHICAASEHGPRYDPNQTPEERSSIANAIWVCEMHGTEIDRDASPYPAKDLVEWKKVHEKYVKHIVSMGIREAPGLPGGAHGAQHLAARLLSRLSDRHILWEKPNNQTPYYARGSIDIIRDRLTDLRAEARDYPPLEARIAVLLSACGLFMREAGPMESRRKLLEEEDKALVDRFTAALLALRKTFGLQVKQVSEVYRIDVGSPLATIIPTDEG